MKSCTLAQFADIVRAQLEVFYTVGAEFDHKGLLNLLEFRAGRPLTKSEQRRAAQVVRAYVAERDAAEERRDARIADHIDGYDRDDIGESPDY